MRRRPGSILPLEQTILEAASRLQRRGSYDFHGFAMAKQLVGHGDSRKLTAHGTLYKALGRLETAGFLESRWEDPEVAAAENRPRRRLYTLTAAGAAALAETKRQPHSTSTHPRLAMP